MKVSLFNQTYKTSPSFGAMKKNQFNNLDFCCVERYKAPIEKFNSIEDFNKWVNDKTLMVLKSDKLKTHEEIDDAVKKSKDKVINDWVEGLLNKEAREKYSPAMIYMILDSLFNELSYTSGMPPHEFEQDVLDLTLDEINENLKANRKYTFNFSSMYKKNLAKKYIDEEKVKQGIDINYEKPFWIKIPQTKNGEDSSCNVKKLKAIGSSKWCTKIDYKTRKVLEDGDFYICVKGQEAKIGMRNFCGGLFDVQGKLNDFYIPYKYIDIVEKKIEDENLSILQDSKYPLYKSFATEAKKIWEEIPEAIKNRNYFKIMEYFGLEPQTLEKDLYSINRFYGYPKCLNYFSKYGISEKDYFSKIGAIREDAVFNSAHLKDTKNIEYIGGNVSFSDCEIESLNKIRKIGGNLNLINSKVKNFGELEEIKGSLTVSDAPCEDLGKIRYIGGYASLKPCQLKYINQIEGAKNLDWLLELSEQQEKEEKEKREKEGV